MRKNLITIYTKRHCTFTILVNVNVLYHDFSSVIRVFISTTSRKRVQLVILTIEKKTIYQHFILLLIT